MNPWRRALGSLLGWAYMTKRRYGIGDTFLANHPRLTHRLMALLAPFKSDSVVDAQGHRLNVDPGDFLGLTINRVYEPDVTSFLQRSVKKGERAIDLGANIGYFTVLLAHLVGPEGQVIAFEPESENFALLEQNVATNGYANVDLRRQAVADRSGLTFLYRNPTNPGDHRIVAGNRTEGEEVEVVALDDAAGPEFGLVRWIKMDVQGAELAALRGMRRLIESCPSLTIVTEVYPRALHEFGDDPAELSWLVDAGFSVSELLRDGSLRRTTLADLLGRSTVANGKYENVVFAKGAQPAS